MNKKELKNYNENMRKANKAFKKMQSNSLKINDKRTLKFYVG